MGTREKTSARSTQVPDTMAGHGLTRRPRRPPHSHSPRPSFLPLRRNRSRSCNVVLPVLQSETRHASPAWLETSMGALRRDEALHREKLSRKGPRKSFKDKIRGIHRGSAKTLQCKYWEHWRRGACECKW